jgi:hypothetical protein
MVCPILKSAVGLSGKKLIKKTDAQEANCALTTVVRSWLPVRWALMSALAKLLALT